MLKAIAARYPAIKINKLVFLAAAVRSDLAVAEVAQRLFPLGDGPVELGQTVADLAITSAKRRGLVAQAFEAGLEPADLVADEVEADRRRLGHQSAVATGGVGLALQWRQPSSHLSQQVVQPQQAGLGRFEASFGLLSPLAVLQDPGRLFDDGSPILGACVQHLIDLALADDDVLAAADTGVGQQVGDVQQATRDTVELVLGLSAAEQDPGDGHLGELDRQRAGGVVDRERHLRSSERRAVRRSREDHVVHLRTAKRSCALGAEHPRDGIHEVRLPRPVRPHHHGETRLEVEHGLVCERLEAPQCQRLEEHPRPLLGPGVGARLPAPHG